MRMPLMAPMTELLAVILFTVDLLADAKRTIIWTDSVALDSQHSCVRLQPFCFFQRITNVPAGKWRATCAYLNSELPFTGAWTRYDCLKDTLRSMERNTGRAICLGDLFIRTTPSERQNYPDSGSLLSIETFYYQCVSVCSRSSRNENVSSSTLLFLVAAEALSAEVDSTLLALCRLLELSLALSADADGGNVDK